MTIKSIEKDFMDKVSAKIEIVPDGVERFRVFTPFRFNDGDHLSIVLKKTRGRWVLSDEGHTYMHLTYGMDEKQLFSGTREQIILKALSIFDVEDREGELMLEVRDANYGSALYSFVQSLLRISGVLYVSKLNRSAGRPRDTFMNDFRTLMFKNVPEGRRDFNWTHPEKDPKGNYKVDCRINGMPEPILVYALPTDNKARDATIALYEFKKWDIPPFRSIGIIKDPKTMTPKVIDYIQAVCDECHMGINESSSRIKESLSVAALTTAP